MKKNRLFPILLTIFTAIPLSGCYDSREIDETAYIIALGIDLENEETYTYTFQLANPLEMSGGGEGESGGNPDSSVQNFVVSAPDFYIAKNQLNNFLSKNVDMSHLKLIVFSKALEDEGFLNHSQFLMHEREVRPHTSVAVASDTAENFIKCVKPTLEANTAKYYELMGIRSDNIYAPSTHLSVFLDEISIDGRTSVLPMAHSSAENSGEAVKTTSEFWMGTDTAQIDSKNACMRGMAIFKNGEVCGYMNSDCAMIFNILNRKIKSCTVTLKNPARESSNLVFRVNIPKSAGYKIEKSENKYLITVSQSLDMEFIGGFLPEGFASEEELYNFAKQTISQKFTDFFYDLSRGKRADIMNIGDHFKNFFKDTNKWNPDNWQRIFESADFTVNL